MFLVGLPFQALSFGRLMAETENAKRMAAVSVFFLSEGAPSEVRRVALCLRLTIYATSLTAEKDKRGEPTLVSLGRGLVQEKTSILFSDIVSRIPDDPVLEPTETLMAMLQTQVRLIIRFDQYGRFPTRLWRLTKKFNPDGYADACYQFLTVPNEDLDLGFSVLLKEEAWQGGRTEAEALDWLQGAEVKALPSGIFEALPQRAWTSSASMLLSRPLRQ